MLGPHPTHAGGHRADSSASPINCLELLQPSIQPSSKRCLRAFTSLDLLDESRIRADAVASLLNELQAFFSGDVIMLHHVHDDKGGRQADTACMYDGEGPTRRFGSDCPRRRTVAVDQYSPTLLNGVEDKPLCPERTCVRAMLTEWQSQGQTHPGNSLMRF
jgi:hypothetical protein